MPTNNSKTRFDELPATPETLAKLEQLHRIAEARERKPPPDPVEFVLVDPKPRPEWGPPPNAVVRR